MKVLLILLTILLFSACNKSPDSKYYITAEGFGWYKANTYIEKDGCVTFTTTDKTTKLRFCKEYQIKENLDYRGY